MNTPSLFNPFNQLRRFDPLVELEELARSFGQHPLAQQFERSLEMRLDLTEDEHNYQVDIDVPGVHKDDIEVSIDGNRVSVSAEVRKERSQDKRKEVYRERYNGRAYRSFTLPQDVDAGKAEAHYDGGVLTLRLPKKADSKARRLSVN